MKTLAIFVVFLAITVAMQLKESPPIQTVDPRSIGSWGFMGLQPQQSPPSQVGTGGLGGVQLPNNASVPVRLPSLWSSQRKYIFDTRLSYSMFSDILPRLTKADVGPRGFPRFL